MEYLPLPLMKASAKELFFKCVVVYLALSVRVYLFKDYVSADAYLSKFLSEDPSMYDSLEHILLKEMIESLRENNLARFKNAVTRYKQSSDIDKWKLHMFTKIMNKIEKESDNVMKDIDYYK